MSQMIIRALNPGAIRADVMSGDAKKMADKFTEMAIAKRLFRQPLIRLVQVIAIAGKGHETTQMVGTETLPFDDAAVARSALAFLPQGAIMILLECLRFSTNHKWHMAQYHAHRAS